MNIESSSINPVIDTKQTSKQQSANTSDVKFSDELKDLKASEKKEGVKDGANEGVNEKKEGVKEGVKEESKDGVKTKDTEKKENADQTIDSALTDLTNTLNKLNQSEDKKQELLKDFQLTTDNDKEGDDLINNDYNIDNKDLLPQMMPNMNFGGDGQPFSSFMNNSEQNSSSNKLSASSKDLAEEAAILSTMAENIAIANKINAQKQAEENEPAANKIVHQQDGIKKVDTKTNIVQETIVKYDTVLVNEADAEVFANLVQNGEANLNNLAPEAAQKSVEVSKTLADLLAKAMEDNKPVRIEFDNGISVIIKVSREGKLTADFLPSTQVAEAYLKENLPLLKQRFDEQNIEYDELNQRERKEKEQDKKKGREQHE